MKTSYFQIFAFILVVLLIFSIFSNNSTKEPFYWRRDGPGWGWNGWNGWNGWGRRREVFRRPIYYI
jgi:hypothetical protein